MNRDRYRDQIVTCDVGVSLHSKTHPLFMKYSSGTSTVLCISLSELVSCAFSTIPICPFLIQSIFHLLVTVEGSSNKSGPVLCLCYGLLNFMWVSCTRTFLLSLGAHAQRGLQYSFVRPSVCYHVFCHYAQQGG